MVQTGSYLVVTIGGVGDRSRPTNTVDCPKQFTSILGIGRSLIQLTYDRLAGVIPSDNMWVITNQKYVSLVHEQLPETPLNHTLGEPYRRNTASCIAYMSRRTKKENPKVNIVVSPSDHVVTNEAEFKHVISNCLKSTAETDAMVTLGMKPTRPETGYGYTQAGLSIASACNHEVYRVDQFREKPDLLTVEQYIKQNNFFWSTEIFIRGTSTIVNALCIYQPGVARVFERIMGVLDTADEQRTVDGVYPECENISVDYAVMEGAEETFICPTDLGWSDLGTQGSLFVQTQHDIYGNAVIGNGVHLSDSENCTIHTTEERKIVIQGLDGYTVARRDSKLLICRLSEEQRLKQLTGEGQAYSIRIREPKACVGTCSINEVYVYLFCNRRAMQGVLMAYLMIKKAVV